MEWLVNLLTGGVFTKISNALKGWKTHIVLFAAGLSVSIPVFMDVPPKTIEEWSGWFLKIAGFLLGSTVKSAFDRYVSELKPIIDELKKK